jgi:hypothetical protein
VGYSQLVINNLHVDHRSLNLWTNDNNQWKEEGTLEYGGSNTISLSLGHVYTIVVVDQGATGCGRNDPQYTSCQRYTTPSIQGKGDGQTLTIYVS